MQMRPYYSPFLKSLNSVPKTLDSVPFWNRIRRFGKKYCFLCRFGAKMPRLSIQFIPFIYIFSKSVPKSSKSVPKWNRNGPSGNTRRKTSPFYFPNLLIFHTFTVKIKCQSITTARRKHTLITNKKRRINIWTTINWRSSFFRT